MIPKIIHCCWFGGNSLPSNLKEYRQSWNKILIGYEIKEWNESNFDINVSVFCKQAYTAKKWAFVSDYVRLYVLYKHGGVYLDSDIEIVKELSPLLQHNVLLGFEASGHLQAGVIGCEKGNPVIKSMLDFYDNISFINDSNGFDTEPIGFKLETILGSKYKQLEKTKVHLIDQSILVCPSRYLCPDLITEIGHSNNYAIHHAEGSWLPRSLKLKQKIYVFISRNKLLLSIYRFLKRKT